MEQEINLRRLRDGELEEALETAQSLGRFAGNENKELLVKTLVKAVQERALWRLALESSREEEMVEDLLIEQALKPEAEFDKERVFYLIGETRREMKNLRKELMTRAPK